jgi:hypothetical protein
MWAAGKPLPVGGADTYLFRMLALSLDRGTERVLDDSDPARAVPPKFNFISAFVVPKSMECPIHNGFRTDVLYHPHWE